jgi:alpha-L-fucosidase
MRGRRSLTDDQLHKFLVDWVGKNFELIDKYQPDILWFDNGVDARFLDTIKLWVAAYYYNRAKTWGKDVYGGSYPWMDRSGERSRHG